MQTPHASATTSTITLSVIDKLSLNVSSLNSDGVFATSDTSANNISVSTNNGTGYMLGIKASTEGGNALVNATDSSKTIPSHTISAGVSKANYNDASYASANNLNNTWGFRPSTYYDTTNNVTIDNTTSNLYFPGPSSATNQFIIDKTTAANATANEYNIALGTRVNSNTAPGKYTDIFIITAVANPTIYSITYNQNTTDTVTNMPTNVVNQPTFDETVNISSIAPARDGFNFKGWCTVQVADGGTCTDTTYNPDGGGTDLAWILDQTVSSNSLTLYAMWEVSYCSTHQNELYCNVADQSKGPQTLAELRTAITTSNSGVYEYNSSVFGTASDAANTSKIYYYRGILDNTVGTYGSDGDNTAWPNTVVLSFASSKSGLKTTDTCWRIVRTTGSGGVKMIYQGKWTGSSCANSEDNAQVTTQVFGLKGNSSQSTYWYRNINRVGYTFNNTASIQDITTATSVDTVFGSNSSPSTNNARSNIKTYIEDTWYANNMTSYTSKLEASAGYCNDRTAFTNSAGTSSMSTIPPYATSSAMFFGAYTRNLDATSATVNKPSLTCPRSTVDLYRYVAGSTGVSNQLKYPAALITADEATFAGSGFSSSTTPYHANSYLRSGSIFWLMSPSDGPSSGNANSFRLRPDGNLGGSLVGASYGVRPAISLTSGTTAASGTGTATDPWIVNPDPPYMQDVDQWKDTLTTVGEQVKVVDNRDGHEYWVSRQADGNIWMTQNLDLDIGGSGVATLTSENTDLNTSGSAPYVDGYSTSGGVITWSPASTATTSDRTISGTTVTPYMPKSRPAYSAPYSAEGGDRYYYTTGTDSDETAQTLAECTAVSGRSEELCAHYHSGNYYNWTAAIASNASDSLTEDAVAANSICPKGWKLPQGRASSDTSTTRQFGYLWQQAGITSSLTATSYATDGFNKIRTSPLFFVRGGYVDGNSLTASGRLGNFWSSSVVDKSYAHFAYFLSSGIYSAKMLDRYDGLSVRCMVR